MRVLETSQEEACWGRQAKERRYLYQGTLEFQRMDSGAPRFGWDSGC